MRLSMWPLVVVVALLPSDGAGMCPAQCSCSSPTSSVSCSGATLSHVPHFLAPDTRILDLSANTIAKLESGLSFYTELLRVNLSSNSLHSLGRNQFSSLGNLKTLDLSNNRLSKIRQGAFAGLHSLQILDMSYNNMERLGREAFTGLVGLSSLDLSYNQISDIDPEAFLHLRRLSHLRLGKNSLSAIAADWPAPLSSLITLDLSQNLIIRLSLTSLSLGKLDLSDNMLSSLPPSSLSVPSLTTLNLAYNKLIQPPPPSLALPSLRSLSLSGNMIRRLEPSALAHLPSLTTLSLSALPRLEALSPLSLRDLHNLTSLSLASSRRLSPLPSDLFTTTPRLASLDLSHLPWTSLSASLLPPSLSSLTLTGLPLVCDCSLLWLWEAQQQRGLNLDGAQCDETPLNRLKVDRLACDQGDYLLVLAALGGVMAFLIIVAIIGAMVKCYMTRRSLLTPPSSKLQCDYLQYTTVPPPPGSPPPKPYYSNTVARGGEVVGGGLDSEGLYYTLQPVYSSSSGSASSDPTCTTSSPYPSPVQYGQYGHPSPMQQCGATVQQYALQHSVAPTTPQQYRQDYLQQSSSASQHSSPLHLLQNCSDPYEALTGGGVGTQKKRTLVKYRYPDVLPSDNANQNYYV